MATRRKISMLKRKRFNLLTLTAITIISFSIGVYIGVIWSHGFGFGGRVWSAENVRETTVKIAAVRSDEVGMILDLKVEIRLGSGQVLVNTDPLAGFYFQDASRTAVKVASKLTSYALDDDGEGLKGADVTFAVSTQTGERVEIIDGPSAGAAATIAVIAAIENRAVKEGVIMTGTIREDGTIGPVGGVFEKAQAANEAGASLFLVPKGQSVIRMHKQVIYEPIPGWQWMTYEPVTVDLNQYAENAGWGIQILEVSRIAEAVDYFLV